MLTIYRSLYIYSFQIRYNHLKISSRMLKVVLVTFVLRRGKTTPRGIAASRLAWNKIPPATPMFLALNYLLLVLSVTLPDETSSQKSKMTAEIM